MGSWRVDVIDTWADASTVLHTLMEYGEELFIRTRILDGDNIGIHVDDGVDDIVEVGVAHVCVDLSKKNDHQEQH